MLPYIEKLPDEMKEQFKNDYKKRITKYLP
jgi:trans-aconitate 2-methyltransferase